VRLEGEPEVDEAPEVERRDAKREPELVRCDTAEADTPVVVGDEPGDRSLDHRAEVPVVLGEVPVPPGTPGSDEEGVVEMEA
jgi:hypothetical protein